MTHKRKSIRHEFETLIKSEFPEIAVETNRAHRISAFPFLNIMNGQDNGEIPDYTNTDEPRRMDLKIDIAVSDNNHDDQIDDILERIENVIKANRKNNYWSRCFFNFAEEPNTSAGDKNYSIAPVYITFMYEVDANV